MDKPKVTEFKVSFENPGLTPEQERKLKEALRSAVVAVLTARAGVVFSPPKVRRD